MREELFFFVVSTVIGLGGALIMALYDGAWDVLGVLMLLWMNNMSTVRAKFDSLSQRIDQLEWGIKR